MGNIDSLPVVSQVKSLVQVIGGDAEGARQTQVNFSQQCPVVSQARSLVEVIGGDAEAARKTQMRQLESLSDMADGLPVVGHIKGGIHYACGDGAGGDKAMKSASRTTGVIAGGIIGTVTGGPVGAVAGGIAGGVAMDGITTGVESAVHGEYRPNGTVGAVTNMVNGNAKIGDYFDLGAGVVMDGIAGHGAGVAWTEARDLSQHKPIYRVMPAKEAVKAVEDKKFPRGYNQDPMKGETWFSESLKHQRAFLERKVRNEAPLDWKALEGWADKDFIDKMKQDCIQQGGSKKTNDSLLKRKEDPKNITNKERLEDDPDGHINIGIKGDKNLARFNDHVKKITEIDLNDPKSYNRRNLRFKKALGYASAEVLFDGIVQRKRSNSVYF